MPPQVASLIYIIGIVGLFRLDQDRTVRTSRALWLPTVWLLLAASRSLSEWMAILGLGQFGVSIDSPEAYLEGSPFDRNVFMLLTAIGIGVLYQRQRRVQTLLRTNGLMLLFFFYCAVSAIWSEYTDVALKRWIKALGDPVMILIILTESDWAAAMKRVMSRVGFILLPVSVLFIKYYPAWGREYSHFDGRGSFTGVTTSKNLLGVTVLVFGLGAVWRLCLLVSGAEGKRRLRPIIAQGAVILIALWLFSMADSATSWSCFLMASALMILSHLHRLFRKPMMMHILVFVLVGLSVFSVLGGSLLGAVGRDSTLTGRTEIWDLVLSMRGNAVVGTGFESFWLGWRRAKIWNAYRFHLNEAHNGYIEVYLNLGWLGIALLAAFTIAGYRNAMMAFRQDPRVCNLRLAFLVVALVYALTEAAFRMQSPIWMFFLLATIVIPRKALQPSPQKHPEYDKPTERLDREPVFCVTQPLEGV